MKKMLVLLFVGFGIFGCVSTELTELERLELRLQELQAEGRILVKRGELLAKCKQIYGARSERCDEYRGGP